MKAFLRLGGIAGFLLALFACGRKLPTPPPPAPSPNDTTRVVLAEMFSTMDCTNCPQADIALHNLLEAYGTSRLIVVEYHPISSVGRQTDSLGTAKTVARLGYYGLRNPPVCIFDGLRRVDGAGSVAQTYETYHDTFEVESARRTPVALGLTVSPQTGVATIKARAFGTVPSPLVLQTVVIEDSVYVNYRNPNFINFSRFVARDIVPDQNGDTLTLAQGDTLSRTRSIVVQSGWKPKDIYIVAFLQNPANKEVLQSTLVKLIP